MSVSHLAAGVTVQDRSGLPMIFLTESIADIPPPAMIGNHEDENRPNRLMVQRMPRNWCFV